MVGWEAAMTEAERVLDRIRTLGANLSVSDEGLQVINKGKLPAAAFPQIRLHRKELAKLLELETAFLIEERAAIIEFSGKAPREWAEQFARILYQRRPAGVSDLDWSWFITKCGQIIDEAPRRDAA
jgi:hypothetical protein